MKPIEEVKILLKDVYDICEGWYLLETSKNKINPHLPQVSWFEPRCSETFLAILNVDF